MRLRLSLLLLLAGCASPQEEWRAAALELGGACAEAGFNDGTYSHDTAMELLLLCDRSYRGRTAEELERDAARVRELALDR